MVCRCVVDLEVGMAVVVRGVVGLVVVVVVVVVVVGAVMIEDVVGLKKLKFCS